MKVGKAIKACSRARDVEILIFHSRVTESRQVCLQV